ncbi:hypothetical protein EJM43_09185 [Salmonella enterica]|nr:hypothetical protein [Salmonella enterica]HAW5561581.1 hypothetical protein [Salmonella enterica]
MRVTTRKKPQWRDFVEQGIIKEAVAVRTEQGRWRLFGLYRNTDAAVFVEAARGGIREWSSLDRVADFCRSVNVSRWQVHWKI